MATATWVLPPKFSAGLIQDSMSPLGGKSAQEIPLKEMTHLPIVVVAPKSHTGRRVLSNPGGLQLGQ